MSAPLFPPTPDPLVDADLPNSQLAHFQVCERIGQGGMGDVYRGYEPDLDRPVAIKVLPVELAQQADFVQRFHIEAAAAARLVHPHILPIHFIGEDRGRHFFVMQYVEGESLAQRLVRGRVPVAQAVPIMEQVLSGLAAAHRQGLVHRDIKPGNILLDRKQNRALLADFGLVKSREEGQGITVTGVIMGTADYLSPEQGRGQDVDGRSDLYSLGVVCYELLSGRLPFQADSPTAMIFQHAYETPPRLDERDSTVPGPLAAIVARLLAKSPAARHQTADEVLADLQAYRRGEALAPETDRWLTPAGEGSNRARTSIIVAPQFAAPPALPPELEEPLPGWWRQFSDRVRDGLRTRAPEWIERLQNTQQQVDGAVAEYERRVMRFHSLAREAEAALAELQAQADAWHAAAEEADQKCRTADREEVRRQAAGELAEARRQEAEMQAALRLQQEQLETMRVRQAQLNATLQRLRTQCDLLNARLRMARPERPGIRRARWALAGICACVLVGIAAVWATRGQPLPTQVPEAAEPVVSVPAVPAPVEPVSAAPTVPIAVSEDPAPATPPPATPRPQPGEDVNPFQTELIAQPVRSWEGHAPRDGKAADIIDIAFAPDDQSFVSLDRFGEVYRWQAASGELVEQFKLEEVAGTGYFRASPDGRWAAAFGKGSSGAVINLWDLSTGKRHRSVPAHGGQIVFSGDGRRVVNTATDGQPIKVYDVESGEELASFAPPKRMANAMVLNFDGSLLATGGPPGAFSLLSTDGTLQRIVPIGARSAAMSFAFSADGAWLAVGLSDENRVLLFETSTMTPVARLEDLVSTPVFLRFDARGRSLIVDDRRSLRIWDLALGYVRKIYDHFPRGTAVSRDGRTLATFQGPKLNVWNAELPPLRPERELKAYVFEGRFVDSENPIPAALQIQPSVSAVSPDGKLAAFGDLLGEVLIWNYAEQRVVQRVPGLGQGGYPTQGLAFSPDGKTLAVGRNGMNGAYFWNIETGSQEFLDPQTSALSVAYSPDGRYLATGSWSEKVREDIGLWDTATARPVRHFAGDGTHWFRSVAFSPDGRRVLSTGKDDLRLWDVESAAELGRIEIPVRGALKDVAFSRDGRLAIVIDPVANTNIDVTKLKLVPGKQVVEKPPKRNYVFDLVSHDLVLEINGNLPRNGFDMLDVGLGTTYGTVQVLNLETPAAPAGGTP